MCRAISVLFPKKAGRDAQLVRSIAAVLLAASIDAGNRDGYFIGVQYASGEYAAVRTLAQQDAFDFIARIRADEKRVQRVDIHARAATHGGATKEWIHGWAHVVRGDTYRLWHNGVGEARGYPNDSYSAFMKIMEHVEEGDSVSEAIKKTVRSLYMSGVYMLAKEGSSEVYVFTTRAVPIVRNDAGVVVVASMYDVLAKSCASIPFSFTPFGDVVLRREMDVEIPEWTERGILDGDALWLVDHKKGVKLWDSPHDARYVYYSAYSYGYPYGSYRSAHP